MGKYSKSQIENILKYINKYEWYKALPLLKDYYKRYPTDYPVVSMYVNTLVKLGYIDEAENILDNVNYSKVKLEKTKETFKFVKLKLLIVTGRYEEALALLQEGIEFEKEEEVYYVKAFLKGKLGLEIHEADYTGYVYLQILSYDEKRMLENIQEDHMGSKDDKSAFDASVDINKLLEVVKKNLTNSPCMYRGLFVYESYFKLPGCGTYKGQKADYIYVGMLNGSKDILFMFPDLNEENYPSFDISDQMVDTSSYTRRRSQIDKFNAKYKNHIG